MNRIMRGRVEKTELVRLVSQRVQRDVDTVEEILDATLEEIYQAIKRGESVSLRNFGSFYVRPGEESWLFKFNPSQRLRRLFGWASTYRGEL
jgi:DNA-binding protein HU-beta